MGLRGRFSALESAHPTFYGLNGSPNALLDEVRGEIGLVAKAFVECTFCLGFRGDVVAIVAVSAPLARGVGAVFELLDCLSEGSVGSVRYVKFDYGGTTVFHCISH